MTNSNRFDGALIFRNIPHARRAFAFEVTFFLARLGPYRSLGSRKPPLHFHPYQEEYVEVLEGCLVAEVEGREHLLRPGDGEFHVPPWKDHRLYQPLDTHGQDARQPGDVTRFVISAEDTSELYRLDTVFFQNWYGYQDEVALKKKKPDIIQVMCMFDAGGSYLSLPRWMPLNKGVVRVVGIVIGRWLGGLLGYQPFYRKWTTDWELSCKKMASSAFQKRFAN
ncbi:hypothetical protein F4779DRAFT_637567 [Xylariaceae sp. FL0662B]|nr:hypothetical protein F4779DRAFT_637567 [Xylariaceae sp. FL0662B]